MRFVALVDQPKQRQQAAPAAAALVHRVGIERGVLGQRRVKTAHRIARLVDLPRPPVGARRQKVAVFGVEHEDQAHQNGEQAFIEMIRMDRRQFADERRLGAVQPAQQLVERAEHLLRQCGRDRRLGVAAPLQKRRQAMTVGRQ